ncbi:MAG: 50S ribosomal protein L18 [Candidatus Buchananbacteria bacterium]
MNKEVLKNQVKQRRHNKVRAKISGTSDIPRISVFRSAAHISVQLIDDSKGVTLAAVTDQEVKEGKTKTEKAFEIGKLLAKKALDKKIAKAVFDKSSYKYHGRVKALADGAREAGLKI